MEVSVEGPHMVAVVPMMTMAVVAVAAAGKRAGRCKRRRR